MPRLLTRNVNYTNTVEAGAARAIRGLAPWVLWLLIEPVAGVLFLSLAQGTHHRVLVAWLLAGVAVVISWFTVRMSHARGLGRFQHALNALAGIGWLAAITRWGFGGFHGELLIAYACGGLLLCLAWNIRYLVHSEGVEDVMPKSARPAPAVNWKYVVRAIAGRHPAIRSGAEKAGNVVPALTSPWREPGVPATATAGKPVIAGVVEPEGMSHEDAVRAARAIVANWRHFTTVIAPELNGARMKVLEVTTTRIRCEIILLRGVHIPKTLIDHREYLASHAAMPLASVIIRAHPTDHHRVFLDWVLHDVLATTKHWPGPLAVGKSIADAPVKYAVYEDGVLAEAWQTAITPQMATRLGITERNLAHVLLEGMTGAGKSTTVRLLIADGSTRLDVEDWVIDPIKKYQTLGCVAGGMKWFAVDVAESRAMVSFLARAVIPARANWLGLHGYDEWEAGCGIPFLRFFVEEGGIIASELDRLDEVANSARSAGVKMVAGFQRAQHQNLDPNVRGAFGENLSFGCKDLQDAFMLGDELRQAGADPSIWADRQPGMHYREAAGLDLQRMLMPLRSFQPSKEECTAMVAEHAPVRDEWIARNCPDWEEMLRTLDANGIYARRTTGAAIIERMEAGKAGRRGPLTAVPDLVPSQRRDDDDDDEDIVDAQIVGEDEDGEDPPVTLEELKDAGVLEDPDLIAALREDEDIDALDEVDADLDEDEDGLMFPRPARTLLSRDDALATLRRILAGLGTGREFAPNEIYEEACEATGKSPSWVRGELSTTLEAEGAVLHDRLTGIYTVTDRTEAPAERS